MPSPPPFSEPRHRYYEVMTDGFEGGTDRQNALHALLFPKEGVECTDVAVAKAYMSYQNPGVRAIFDACLLARATAEELATAFGVDQAEYAAYAELFFDMRVFPNDFHVIAYLRGLPTTTEEDRVAQDLLTQAFRHGFAHVRFAYASTAKTVATPMQALERVFEADSKRYLDLSATPLNHKTAKELRSLGKHVVSVAAALNKTSAAGPGKASQDADFVLESAPPNPTLDELRAKGVEFVN